MGRGFFTSTWILLLAGALAACASKASDPNPNGYAGMYAKYDCSQLEALRGAAIPSSGDDAGGKLTINASKQDVAEIEAAAKAKGCNIDLRGYRR
jgi:hypothetical protein